VFSGFGPTELIIVLAIVLLIFGPKRLPGLGRQVGTAMREFKDSITSRHDDDEAEGERRDAAAALARPDEEPGATAAEPARERTPQP
jgi:sec-independent protein translocase protein TatA